MKPQTRYNLAVKLAHAAWIMGGFEPPTTNLILKRFQLGRTHATPDVIQWAEQHTIDLDHYLHRHHCGDWGDLDIEDKKSNEEAVIHGGRILSTYLIDDQKIYVITEADRSMTTILFSCEY